MIAATTWMGAIDPGRNTAAARTVGIGLIAVAVVVADAAPWSSRSQTQIAVSDHEPDRHDLEADDGRAPDPGHERGERQQDEGVAEVEDADELAGRGAGRQLLADERLRGVRDRRQEPEQDGGHGPSDWCATVAPWYRDAQPDCKRYRYRQASAPGREGRVAETTIAFTELLGRRVRMGPWEDQKISTYRKIIDAIEARPVGRGGHPGQLLRRRGERLLHALSPVDRRPERLPARQGRRRGRSSRRATTRRSRSRRCPTARRGTRASTGTASSARSRTSPRRPTASSRTRPSAGST